MQAQAQPGGDFSPATVRKTNQLAAVGNGHDAGHDGHLYAQFSGIFHITKVAIGIEKILRNHAIGTRIDLGFERPNVRLHAFGLRVHIGVAGHLDMKGIACFVADEAHQIAGIGKFAAHAVATGQIAAQGHQALHPHGLQLLQLLAHGFAGSANARKMAGRIHAFLQDFLHGIESAGAGRATRAIRHRTKFGLERIQLLAHLA